MSFGSPPPLTLGTAPPAQLPGNVDGAWTGRSGPLRANMTVLSGWVTHLQVRNGSMRALLPAPVRLRQAGDGSTAAALLGSGRTPLRVEIRRAGSELTLACACPHGRLLAPLRHQGEAGITP
jgi:hypothetical protein